MSLPQAVTIHGLDHGHIALRPGRPVLLLSAPGAALYAGAGWWRALIAALDTTQPDAIDCADAPGRALEALATACRIVILSPCPAWPSIAERAGHALLLDHRPPSLDLADRAQIAAWLATGSPPATETPNCPNPAAASTSSPPRRSAPTSPTPSPVRSMLATSPPSNSG